MLKRFIKHCLYGKRATYPFFKKLHTIALGGMNYGQVDFRQSGELRVLRSIREEHPLIFDVGAHSGHYAEAVIACLGPSCRLHCFEPAPEPFEKLRKRLAKYDNVRLNNFALGDKEETKTLCGATPMDSGAFILDSAGLNSEDHCRGVPVRVQRLDRYCADNCIHEIALLKLDVEGYELRVLQGALDLLEQQRIRLIQFEFGSPAVIARTYLADFCSLLAPWYQINHIVKDGWVPLEYSVVEEVFVTSNYLAIARGREDSIGVSG
jgi:FkbM family methyltransferase